MTTPLTKLAQYWRDDANNADLSLTLPQRDAKRHRLQRIVMSHMFGERDDCNR